MHPSARGRAAWPMRVTGRVLASLIALALVAVPAAAGAGHRARAAIVGGSAASAGALPWLAYIHDAEGGGAYEWCTGTVVSPNLVLTAAHCVEDVSTGTLDPASAFTVVSGSADWSDSAHAQVSAVTRVVPDTTSIETSAGGINVVGDAALLELATSTSAPAVPLFDGSNPNLIAPGQLATIAGWGLESASASAGPATFQVGQTVIQEPAWCYGEQQTQFQPTAQLCAIDDPSYATSACSGDSGGPLLVEASGEWTEVGITSTSATCDTQRPDVFTRVDYVHTWVESWIALLPAPPPPAPAGAGTQTTSETPAAAAAPSFPDAGDYSGRSEQRHGSVSVTLTPAGLTALRVRFNLSCRRGWRGPFTSTHPSSALSLKRSGGSWRFTAAFKDSRGWRYAVAGSFSAYGTARGTLSVTTPGERCESNVIDWRAAIHAG